MTVILVIATLLIAPNAFAKLRAKKMKDVEQNIQNTAPDDSALFQESFPRAEEIKETEKSTGSLWVDSYSSRIYNNLHRASRVGDMVTITIAEEAQGTKNAETKTDRKSTSKFGITGLFGLINKLTSAVSGLDSSQIVASSDESKHDGKGSTKRSGSLTASLTARVMKVLRNGDMQIRGQKNIKLNGEEQALILEGFIRPYDISPDNSIESTYIADARITFNGFGVIADKQNPGWLTRILDKVLPF